MPVETRAAPVEELVDRLAEFEPGATPVLSLYLDARPDQHGRDAYRPWVRKRLSDLARTYRTAAADRRSFDADVDRVERFLREDVDPAANGIAVFAGSGQGLFQAVQLPVPFERHALHVGPRPHLYPLARVLDLYRRYAVVVGDTCTTRIYVAALGGIADGSLVESPKERRHDMGGWSQMRFQRHVDAHHDLHAKEVALALARVVRDDRPEAVILGGDEVLLPLVRKHLSRDVAERVVDVVRLDARAPQHEVLAASAELFRRQKAQTGREKAQRLLDEYRAGGLAALGLRDVRGALHAGQAHEVLLAASPATLPAAAGRLPEEVADEIATLARRTDAELTLLEDAALLDDVGGVGALLRYRLTAGGPAVPPPPDEEVP